MKSCDQIRELLPALLADNLPPDEREGVESHVSECASCAVAWANLKRLASILQDAPIGPEPDAELERHIFTLVRHDEAAQLARDAALLPEPPAHLEKRSLAHAGVTETRLRTARPRVSVVLAPAFGLAAVLLAAFLITNESPVSPESPVARPSGHFMQEIRLTGAGEADLSLTHFRQDNYRLTLTDTDQLPPLSEGHHYELWLTGDEGRVSAGNFRYEERDDFAIDFNIGVDPAKYHSVEITEEPDNGDPKKNGDSVCYGSFDPAAMKDF